MRPGTGPRVLVVARAYPNAVLPTQGLWTHRLVRASLPIARPTVIAPVPYFPPGLRIERFARFRRVPLETDLDGIPVHHPRVPAGIGSLLLSYDADLSYPFIRRVADRLHDREPFDLIHAHFIYPDGVIASRLGNRYGIPVMTTDQSIWGPALSRYPRMRHKVARALPGIALMTGVSGAVRKSFLETMKVDPPYELIPNVVDEFEFPAPAPEDRWDPDQILFVGLVRRVKGLDVLVRGMSRVRQLRPQTRLLVLGGTFHPGQRPDWDEVQRLVRELDLEEYIRFGGEASPPEVAAAMRGSALLILPSRREALAAVILEALASGTPVVATRCGGPEEVLTPELGRLVPVEDPDELAMAIVELLAIRPQFDRTQLRETILGRFGTPAVTARLAELYGSVLGAPSESRGQFDSGRGGTRSASGD